MIFTFVIAFLTMVAFIIKGPGLLFGILYMLTFVIIMAIVCHSEGFERTAETFKYYRNQYSCRTDKTMKPSTFFNKDD